MTAKLHRPGREIFEGRGMGERMNFWAKTLWECGKHFVTLGVAMFIMFVWMDRGGICRLYTENTIGISLAALLIMLPVIVIGVAALLAASKLSKG